MLTVRLRMNRINNDGEARLYNRVVGKREVSPLEPKNRYRGSLLGLAAGKYCSRIASTASRARAAPGWLSRQR